MCGRIFAGKQTSVAVPQPLRPHARKIGYFARTTRFTRSASGRRRQPFPERLCAAGRTVCGTPRCRTAASDVVAFHAAGGLRTRQPRPFRAGLRSLCPFHFAHPPLSRFDRTPRHQSRFTKQTIQTGVLAGLGRTHFILRTPRRRCQPRCGKLAENLLYARQDRRSV